MSKEYSKEELVKLAQAATALQQQWKYNFLDTVFPDKGPLRRELYPKHVEFLNGGSKYPERLFCAANQVGKTTTILEEGILHATGLYPHWWEGKRFKRPNVGIFGAESWEHMRTGIQAKLFTGADRGYMEKGTGLIPKKIYDRCQFTAKGNVTGVVSEMLIPHVSGGMSKIIFRTYDRQEAWESMTLNWCMLDEEPPREIYTEAAMRIVKNDGTIAIGFTPDSGLTATVLHFFKNGQFSAGAEDGKLITMVGWDDVPHITEKAKRELIKTIPEHLIDCKTKGLPYAGVGKVFQMKLDNFLVDPFEIPDYYERCYAVDPGVSNAAVLWGAIDPQNDTMYVTDEFLGHNMTIYTVTDVIRSHGKWIPGVMDPFYGPQASRVDATKIIDLYKDTGLDIELCDRKGTDYKEGGIETIKVALITGKLKIFRTCQNLYNQLNLYHRTSTGKTGNTPDDLVDALRYLVTGGKRRAESYCDYIDEKRNHTVEMSSSRQRNKTTGY